MSILIRIAKKGLIPSIIIHIFFIWFCAVHIEEHGAFSGEARTWWEKVEEAGVEPAARPYNADPIYASISGLLSDWIPDLR